jgi:orotate phosphoribosyltransferase
VPFGVAVAIDRQEKATENGRDVDHSAVQYVRQQLGMQVVNIAQLDDVIDYLTHDASPETMAYLPRVQAYRERYGAR